MTRALSLLLLLAGCGSHAASGYAGSYAATFSGNWTNTSPNTLSGTYDDSATVTVSDSGPNEVELVWQVGGNPPSGSIVFALSGSSGTAVTGGGVGGHCFMGKLSNGNSQTSCCDSCSVAFAGGTFTQNQVGHYMGVTPQGIGYTGNYTGVWSGTRH
jgi:hypothetical protein